MDNGTTGTFQAIKQAIDRQAEVWDLFKQTNDDRLKALQSGNETKARELDEKLGRIEADLNKFGDIKKNLEIEQQLNRERIEELEARAKTPGKSPVEKRENEYKDAFISWMRNKGNSPVDEQKLIDLSRKMMEAKDITVGSQAGGGYLLPKVISDMIEQFELKFSPVRRLVNVVKVSTTDYHQVLNLRGTTSGWVGEQGPRPATATATFRDIVPTHGELYAYPQVSEWALDDLQFNVENWLAEQVGDEFALQEGLAVISGNGTNKPTGLVNTAPVTTADGASPLRAAAALQFITSSASPVGVSADALIDLVYAVNSAYRQGSTFVFNSNTTAGIRKLKDTTGQYLWQVSLQNGQPNTLLGYPTETWEQLDDIGSNKYPVMFGNFRRGYLLVDRVGMRITRDNVTNIGFIKFYVRRREGGIVCNNDAIKVLKTT